ncbi:MAG: ATP-binding protein [Flavobacteriales bacterium]|jgi:predicted AAA+ superfamily ATPase
MKRKAYGTLLEWKNSPKRKPLIIQGARQVGKTFLMKQFGEEEFQYVAYFNFESHPALAKVFDYDLSPETIVKSLRLLSDSIIEPENTLIIFDEIQACPKALTSLKYFQENAPHYPILAAGSLLGVAIHQGVSFPVGKVDFLQLKPFDFIEFLQVTNNEKWARLLEEGDWGLQEVMSQQIIQLLKQYLLVGGMPEVVVNFGKTGDLEQVRAIQESILLAYENDFSKHAPIDQLPRIRLVWRSIVGQLAKENSKFVYSVLRKGSRAKDFELAIEWLKDAGLVYKVTRINKSSWPIEAYAIWDDFKLYLHDCGLLGAMALLPPAIILDENRLFTEFKGILSEQFAVQQLVSQNLPLYYWRPQNAEAEVDFLLPLKNQIIPLEIKSSENVRSRSLSVYAKTYEPKICVRASLLPYRHQQWLENIPLFSLGPWLQKNR